ncbi:hypothetical protein PBY51_022908 [Eleginops maclovinus]|uniref:Uncharacterized protein n=1 Tax=Eleginops maclovinus TaxID=56733 RepID=A0AAN7XIF6_ELEMC|nr:hypothetical protein PBY51_022908 [Eleginops maclovinus]
MCQVVNTHGELSVRNQQRRATLTRRQMRCNRNRLPGLLLAGPLDKKKDEETLFNKAARLCQATICPTGTARDETTKEGAESSREVRKCEVPK